MRSRIALYAVASFAIAGCSTGEPATAGLDAAAAVAAVQSEDAAVAITAMANEMNANLAAEGASYRISQAEWLGADNAGSEVFFNNRGNKRLTADFIPGDPRRGGRTNITYWVRPVGFAPTGLTSADVTGAISRAMTTWDNVNCSTLPITQVPNRVILATDIIHEGFAGLPPGVLGVTFTSIFIDGPGGPPTDLDNNGLADVALRQIFYASGSPWHIGATFDLETVALHEAGHGLSQDHFGKAFLTESNDQIHFAPRAVMNAAYSGIQQTIGETDNAGHCANWANWPNK